VIAREGAAKGPRLQIDRRKGTTLGVRGSVLGIEWDMRTLGITRVNAGGSVALWNAENPDMAVHVGDKLVAVNGHCSSKSIFEELLGTCVVELTLDRPCPPVKASFRPSCATQGPAALPAAPWDRPACPSSLDVVEERSDSTRTGSHDTGTEVSSIATPQAVCDPQSANEVASECSGESFGGKPEEIEAQTSRGIVLPACLESMSVGAQRDHRLVGDADGSSVWLASRDFASQEITPAISSLGASVVGQDVELVAVGQLKSSISIGAQTSSELASRMPADTSEFIAQARPVSSESTHASECPLKGAACVQKTSNPPNDAAVIVARRVEEITRRGRIDFDMRTGAARIIFDVRFKPRYYGRDRIEEPLAQLENPSALAPLVKDINDLCGLFPCKVELVQMLAPKKDHGFGVDFDKWQLALTKRRVDFVAKALEDGGLPKGRCATRVELQHANLDFTGMILRFDWQAPAASALTHGEPNYVMRDLSMHNLWQSANLPRVLPVGSEHSSGVRAAVSSQRTSNTPRGGSCTPSSISRSASSTPRRAGGSTTPHNPMLSVAGSRTPLGSARGSKPSPRSMPSHRSRGGQPKPIETSQAPQLLSARMAELKREFLAQGQKKGLYNAYAQVFDQMVVRSTAPQQQGASSSRAQGSAHRPTGATASTPSLEGARAQSSARSIAARSRDHASHGGLRAPLRAGAKQVLAGSRSAPVLPPVAPAVGA